MPSSQAPSPRHLARRRSVRALAVLAALAALGPGPGCGNREPMPVELDLPGRDRNAAGLRLLRAGDLEGAEEAFRDAATGAAAVDDRRGRAEALYNLGVVRRARGDPEEAIAEFERAAELFARIGAGEERSRTLVARAVTAIERGRLAVAERILDGLIAEAPEPALAEVRAALAALRLHQGRAEEAVRLAEEAAEDAVGDAARADALWVLARARVRTGDPAAALALLDEVLALDRRVGRRARIAETLRALGRLYRRLDEEERAADHLARAAEVWEALGRDAAARAAREERAKLLARKAGESDGATQR